MAERNSGAMKKLPVLILAALISDAAVAFAAAANSWDGSAELRVALLDTARKITVPIMLLQTSNDYSVMPGRALAAEMARLSKPHVLKIYPSFGHTADDGHNLVYL